MRIIIIVFILAMIYWRFAARRYTLPCPSLLSWIVDNPFMNTVAGAGVILDRMQLKPGMRVLDVGCGPGRLTVPAAERIGVTGEVTALDIQEGMLRQARQKVETSNLTNVRFIQAGAGEGKVEDGYYDRAVLVTVLGEIPDRRAALAEIYRALKPGGLLSVTEVLPDPHYQTEQTVRKLAAEAGFEVAARFDGFPAYTLHLVKPDGH